MGGGVRELQRPSKGSRYGKRGHRCQPSKGLMPQGSGPRAGLGSDLRQALRGLLQGEGDEEKGGWARSGCREKG